MNKTEWHKGNPPSIGWWPASVCRDAFCLRWWDGKKWSDFATPIHSAERAALSAKRKLKPASEIFVEWTDKWWEKA